MLPALSRTNDSEWQENGQRTVPSHLEPHSSSAEDGLRSNRSVVLRSWDSEGGTPEEGNENVPAVIIYDFQSYGDKNYQKEPTGTLTIENAHIPISVSIGDTLEREPTPICERDPGKLVRKFMKELETREKHPGPGARRVRSRRRAPAAERAATKHLRMVQPGTDIGVQLGHL